MKKLSICFFPLLLFLITAVSLVSCQSQKVQELVKENEELHAKNEALRNENAELRTQNEELKGKLSKLESKEIELGKAKEIELGKAREAIKALQRLDARFSAGINPVDFPPALGETIFQVNLFLESPEAGKMPQLAEAIKKVLFHYKVIGEIMDSYMARVVRIPLRETLKSTYPEVSNIYRYNYSYWDLKDIAVKVVLPEASKELEKAKSLLPE